MDSMPDRLFRYRPPCDYTLENLRKRQVWFSKPENFNDPFDCAIRVDRDMISEEEYWELFRHLRQEKGEQIADQFLQGGQLTEEFKKQARRGSRRAYEDQKDKMLHQRGAVCFSAIPPDHQDSILQWSHYAGAHTGICLEFDTCFPLFQEGKLFQVRYSDTVPSIGPFEMLTSDIDALTPMIATKADCWSYEQEWRLFHMEGDRAYTYTPECLTAVYLGCEAAGLAERIEPILQGSSTNLYQVHRDQKQFRLSSEPVS